MDKFDWISFQRLPTDLHENELCQMLHMICNAAYHITADFHMKVAKQKNH